MPRCVVGADPLVINALGAFLCVYRSRMWVVKPILVQGHLSSSLSVVLYNTIHDTRLQSLLVCFS